MTFARLGVLEAEHEHSAVIETSRRYMARLGRFKRPASGSGEHSNVLSGVARFRLYLLGLRLARVRLYCSSPVRMAAPIDYRGDLKPAARNGMTYFKAVSGLDVSNFFPAIV
jgi:hypothetical protein